MNHNLYSLGYLKSSFGELDEVQNMIMERPLEETPNETYELESNELDMSNMESVVNNVTTTSVDNSLDKLSQVLNMSEVQSLLKDNGLDVIVKNTSREMVKNVLTLMGLWYATKLVKNKYVLSSLGMTAAYLYFRRPDTQSKSTLV